MIKGIGKKVFIVGIGGISLSAIAKFLIKNNHYVAGSDLCYNEMVDSLKNSGIEVFIGHNAKNIKGFDTVVYTSAVNSSNPELLEARQLGLQILSRAECLSLISNEFKNVVAISGSHGKTTATALIFEVLFDAKKDVSLHIGGNTNRFGNVYISQKKDILVTEACEYKDNFLKLSPSIGVVLNIQPDHLDYFKNFDNLKKSFEKFKNRIRKYGIFIANADDENSNKLLSTRAKSLGFGIENSEADFFAENIYEYKKGFYSFDFFFHGFNLGNFKCGIPGKYNIYNSMVAIIVGIVFDVDIESIKKSIYKFTGVKRRMEPIGEICVGRRENLTKCPHNSTSDNNESGKNEEEQVLVKVIADYAHHPTEIKKVIELAKSCADGKVIAVFQPHTYSRTKSLFEEFVESLSVADYVVTFPIYSARENPIENVTSENLAIAIKNNGKNCQYASDFSELKSLLGEISEAGDIILILGAGDIIDFRYRL